VTILKIPRFLPVLQAGRLSSAAQMRSTSAVAPAEGLDAFGSEAEPVPPKPQVHVAKPSRKPAQPLPEWVVPAARLSAVIVVTAAIAIAGMFTYQKRSSSRATTGAVTFETTPSGLDVMLAGKPLGKTPLTTSLAAGSYEMQVGSGSNARTIKVNVAAGTSVVQRFEFAQPSPTEAAVTGGLRVQTEPSHLPVFVDGSARGVSPVAIGQLQQGQHEISVRTSAGVVRRAVTIQPRETLSLIVSSTAPPPERPAVSAGWVSVSAPIALQLREGGQVIGTSESDRLMLPAGDHDIEFVNDTLGFSQRRTVRVTAGKTAAAKVDLPNGALSINAQPWAEVWIDGERVGETPIGNLSRRIGTHEVVFRHPDLGERRQMVVIAVGKPARIGVDLRKK
jgi:hypothetical protein